MTETNPNKSTDVEVFDKPVQFLAGVITDVQRFQPTVTTPKVEHHNIWKANNTTAITITNFLLGSKGQTIYILGDGFTTIANNATIKTNTGSNKLLLTNQVYTFVNYDNVWYEVATPTIAGDPWSKVILGSDQTTTNATQTAVSGLSFTPAANKQYAFEFYIAWHKLTGTSYGFRLGVDWPSGTTYVSTHIVVPASATTMASRHYGTATNGLYAEGMPGTNEGDTWLGKISGLIKTGGSPSGSVQVTYAASIVSNQVRVKAGSTLLYREV